MTLEVGERRTAVRSEGTDEAGQLLLVSTEPKFDQVDDLQRKRGCCRAGQTRAKPEQ